jgi:alpha-galactosidase
VTRRDLGAPGDPPAPLVDAWAVARDGRRLELAVELRARPLRCGTVVETSVALEGRAPAAVDRVVLTVPARPTLVLEHGWQSWSTVRVCRPAEVVPARAQAPWWLRAQLHADPALGARAVAGDGFLLHDGGLVGFLAERRHLGTVLARPAARGEDGSLEIVAHLDGMLLEPGAPFALEPLWHADGDPGAAYSAYAELAGRHLGARTATLPPLGWCSWYQYGPGLDATTLARQATLARAAGLGLFQVDDGWQRAIGDWTSTRDGLGASLGELADMALGAGLVPGLWTAPFLVASESPIATSRADWLVRDRDGRPLVALRNGAWGGAVFVLDTTVPAVLEHLEATYALLASLGFSYHKIDFSYAAALPGRRHDPAATRAQALVAGLAAIRRGLGEESFLLGCGVPLLPATGFVDAARVGEDVAPYWEPRDAPAGYDLSCVGARNALSASLLRAPLHRRLFLNDPDCLLLRPTATELSAAERLALARCALGLGGYLVVSDDLGLYGRAEHGLLASLAACRRDVDAPVDLPRPFDTPLRLEGPRHRLIADAASATAEIVGPGAAP